MPGKSLRSRVSFSTSPDKTIDSTPPSSPEIGDCVESENTLDTIEDSNHNNQDKKDVSTASNNLSCFDDNDDMLETQPKNQSNWNKATEYPKTLRVNKILCRVPSHESIISDLSASLSPTHPHFKYVGTTISDPSRERRDNPIYSLFNACGVVSEISDLISYHNSLAMNPTDDTNFSVHKHDDRYCDSRTIPAVWGIAPSEEQMSAFVAKGIPSETVMNDHDRDAAVQYDNVELVLDENALSTTPNPPQHKVSSMTSNKTLKKKVSGIIYSGRYSPMSRINNSSSPQTIFTGPPVSISTASSSANSDPRISHTYDIASFQSESLRPASVEQVKVHDEPSVVATTVSGGTEGNKCTNNESKHESLSLNENKPRTPKSAFGAFVKKKNEGIDSTSIKLPKEYAPTNESIDQSLSNSHTPRKFQMRGLSFKRKKSFKIVAKNEVTNSVRSCSTIGLESKEETSTSPKVLLKSTSRNALSPRIVKSMKKTESQPIKPTMSMVSLPSQSPVIPIDDDVKYWKSNLDKSSNKTYYYHSKTKMVQWDKPAGFDEVQKQRDEFAKETKYWRSTIDINSGKTYYYHSKTKEVTWSKPDGFKDKNIVQGKKNDRGSAAGADDVNKSDVVNQEVIVDKEECVVENEASSSIVDQKVAFEALEKDKVIHVDEIIIDSKGGEKVPSLSSDLPIVQINPVNMDVEDAPFDEPIVTTSPLRAHLEENLQQTPSSTNEKSLPSNSHSKAPVLNTTPQVQPDSSIKFQLRSRTLMSQLTDKTQRITNITPLVTKDFTDTQIDVDFNNDAIDGNITPLDSSMNSDFAEINTSKHLDGDDKVALIPLKDHSKQTSSNVIIAKSSAVHCSKQREPIKSKESLSSEHSNDDSAVFDDWSDEVSDLSGIGNDEQKGKRKTSLGAKLERQYRTSRTQKLATRKKADQQFPSGRNEKKSWTQQELDNFIAKNDWSSVSKYIAEMRNSKDRSSKSQQSRQENHEISEGNDHMESNDSSPRKKFGAKSQMQHDEIIEETSDISPAQSESPQNSLSSASEESSYDERSTCFDDKNVKQMPLRSTWGWAR